MNFGNVNICTLLAQHSSLKDEEGTVQTEQVMASE